MSNSGRESGYLFSSVSPWSGCPTGRPEILQTRGTNDPAQHSHITTAIHVNEYQGIKLVVRRMLRGRGPQWTRQGACGPRRARFVWRYMHCDVRENPATKCVSTRPAPREGVYQAGCLGMSRRRNELMTLTLPRSGVARGQDRCTQVN